MKPRNNDKVRKDGSVPYAYCCQLKTKSRGQKCQGKNVNGELIDGKIIEMIKETFVPDSEIYKELQRLTIDVESYKSEELQSLKKAHSKNQEEIDNLIKKMKYIDMDLIDIVNIELRKLKENKLMLEEQIDILEKNKKCEEEISEEIKVIKDIKTIIDNSFDIFNTFDLKTKRDIAKLFIESIYGNGDDIEVNLLSTKIDDSSKMIIPTFIQVDNFLNSTQYPDKESKISP